jgi:hypothetical protein
MLKPMNLAQVRRWRPYTWSDLPFTARPWPELIDRYLDLAESHVDYLAIVEIINSVVHRDAVDRLAGNYTVGGLHVVDTELCSPPYSVITVETLGRSRSSDPAVAVWQVSSSGLREEVIAPVDAAVPLFWRFVVEKFATTVQH